MNNPAPRRVGWIVDVQNDFMLPAEKGGRLYVHDLFDDGQDAGASQIVPVLVRAAEWMRAHCDAIVYTGDWHAHDDAEIDRNPFFCPDAEAAARWEGLVDAARGRGSSLGAAWARW